VWFNVVIGSDGGSDLPVVESITGGGGLHITSEKVRRELSLQAFYYYEIHTYRYGHLFARKS